MNMNDTAALCFRSRSARLLAFFQDVNQVSVLLLLNCCASIPKAAFQTALYPPSFCMVYYHEGFATEQYMRDCRFICADQAASSILPFTPTNLRPWPKITHETCIGGAEAEISVADEALSSAELPAQLQNDDLSSQSEHPVEQSVQI